MNILKDIITLNNLYVPKQNTQNFQNPSINQFLPMQPLKSIAYLPCAVENVQKGGEHQKIIIQSSKSLRRSLNIQEEDACSRCQFKNVCKQRGTQEDNNKKDNQFLNTGIVLSGLYIKMENQKDQLKDFEQTAATILITAIDSVFNDFINNSGLTYKSCLQDTVIKQNQKDQSSKPEDPQNKLRLTEVQLVNSKNRSQKRKLKSILEAQINDLKNDKDKSEDNQFWGMVQIRRSKKSKIGVDEKLKLQNYNPKVPQVFNFETNSFVDKQLYEQVSQPDQRNPNINENAKNQKKNTQTLSKNQKLQSINNFGKTLAFSKTTPSFKSYQNSFLKIEKKQRENEFIEENKGGLEAIQEAKKLYKGYFIDQDGNTNEDGLRQFVTQIKRKKDVEKMAIGWDEVLLKNEKLQRFNHPVIPSREEVSKIALGIQYNVQNKMVQDGLEQIDKFKKLEVQNKQLFIDKKQNKLQLVKQKENINQLQESLEHLEIQKNQFLYPQENNSDNSKFKKPDINQMNELERIEVQNVKSKKKENNQFVISKARNLENLPSKSQYKQKQKLLKNILDDKYIAENYYKGFQDNESILFERDGIISKIKQFDYKVHKFIKQPKQIVVNHSNAQKDIQEIQEDRQIIDTTSFVSK